MCTHLVWTFTTIISIITTIAIIIKYTVTATITPVTTPTITVTATITPVNYAVPATARTIAIIAVSGTLTTTTTFPRLTTATTSTHRHHHPRHHIFHFPTMTQRRGRGIQQLASLLFEPSAPQNSHLHDRLLVITGFSRSLTAHRTRLTVLVLNNSSLRSLLHY